MSYARMVEAEADLAREVDEWLVRAEREDPAENAEHRSTSRSDEPPDWVMTRQAWLAPSAPPRRRWKRKQTVEPVFGIIESAVGHTRFRLRGLINAATRWSLVTLAYNRSRIIRLQAA